MQQFLLQVARGSALRSARLPVNLIGSSISYVNRLIGSPITSQSTLGVCGEWDGVHYIAFFSL